MRNPHKMTVPPQHIVSVYAFGRWKWQQVHSVLFDLKARHHSIVWHETEGWFMRVFILIGTQASIRLFNNQMKIADAVSPVETKRERQLIAGLAVVALLGFTSPLWAGDRDHVGGAASPGSRENSRAARDVARSANAIDDCGCINYDKLGRYLEAERRKTPNPTNYNITRTFSYWTGWGPYSIFSKDFWTNPRSSIGIHTPYSGFGGGGDTVTGGPGIGSWGNGGGTGPGARGY